MKKALKNIILACLTIVVCTGNVWALTLPTPGIYRADYGDATGYNNSGTYHYVPWWQSLGKTQTREMAPYANNGDFDDGVSWSSNGGVPGNNAITVGDDVTFNFVMYKQSWGTHDFDALRVWVDWNQNGTFDDDAVFYQAEWDFPLEGGYQNNDSSAGVSKTFSKILYDINVDSGDYWLRARVVCSRDLGGGDVGGYRGNINELTPTGGYIQGEVEDWKFTVNSVPEPSSLLLLGMGLLGLAGFVRRLKK